MSSRSIGSKKVKISTRKASFKEVAMYDRILKDVATGEATGVLEWTEVLGDNQNPIDQMKYQICQTFIRILNHTGIPQIRLAEAIGVDRARINHIVHCRYQLFSFETLISYLLKVEGISPEADKRIAEIKVLTRP